MDTGLRFSINWLYDSAFTPEKQGAMFTFKVFGVFNCVTRDSMTIIK